MLARALALLAQLQARDGDLTAALEALREGLESAHINGDRSAMAVCLAKGAVVMMAVGEHHLAAVFSGAMTNNVVGRRSAMSSNERPDAPPEVQIPDYDEFVTTLRSQLGDEDYTAATARGAALTYEQAGAFALAAIEGLRGS
jgi:hypothetical protein